MKERASPPVLQKVRIPFISHCKATRAGHRAGAKGAPEDCNCQEHSAFARQLNFVHYSLWVCKE